MPTDRATRIATDVAAGLSALTVLGGAIVCATKSGFDCHAWPGCYDDRFVPGPGDIPAALLGNPALEMVHRIIAMGTGAALIVAAVLVWRARPAGGVLRWLSAAAVVAAGVSALVGRQAVLGLPVSPAAGVADLLAALACMSLALMVAVGVRGGAKRPLGALGRPAAVAFGVLVAMHALGLLAAGYRSFTRCLSWPILWLAHDDNIALQVVRSGLALVALGAIVAAVLAALKVGRPRAAWALAGVLGLVLVLAVTYRATGVDGGVLGIAFGAASVGLLWLLVWVAASDAYARPVSHR